MEQKMLDDMREVCCAAIDDTESDVCEDVSDESILPALNNELELIAEAERLTARLQTLTGIEAQEHQQIAVLKKAIRSIAIENFELYKKLSKATGEDLPKKLSVDSIVQFHMGRPECEYEEVERELMHTMAVDEMPIESSISPCEARTCKRCGKCFAAPIGSSQEHCGCLNGERKDDSHV